jgi:hypothetical protein
VSYSLPPLSGRLTLVREAGSYFHRLALDGREDPQSDYGSKGRHPGIAARITDEEMAADLARYTSTELFAGLESLGSKRLGFVRLKLPNVVLGDADLTGVTISTGEEDFSEMGGYPDLFGETRPLLKKVLLKFEVAPDFLAWRNPWTATEYLAAVQTDLGDHECKVENKGILPGVHVTYERAADEPVINIVTELAPFLLRVINDARRRLASSVRGDALVSYFRFPQETSVASQQYLLYFVEFLRDLGIQATAELKEDARHVLFSVTPASGSQALDRIREALHVYLNLPGSNEAKTALAENHDVAALQLRFQVSSLEAQMDLMRGAVQFRDATIDLLKLENFQLRQAVLVPVEREIRQLPGEKQTGKTEDVFDGLVTVKTIETKMVDINAGELVRRLKRMFSRTDDK